VLRFWNCDIQQDLEGVMGTIMRAATAGFYEESNRRLAAMIGVDLGAFGWRV